MKSKPICIVMVSVVVLLLCGLLLPMIPSVSAEETMIYLSDRQDLLLGEDSLENIGWDTAHSGEPITIGTQAYAKGLGFHCLPDRDAYVEFDISSLGAEENAVVDPDRTNRVQPADRVSGDYAYISDLYWMDWSTYTGNIVGRDCNTANEIIVSTDGKFFGKGVGFHASSSEYTSYIDVNIDGLGFTKFASWYGVSETLSPYDISAASVRFAVMGDGVVLWESDIMVFGQAMAPMTCDITGVKTLRLAVAGCPSISGGWGTWGGAVISKSGQVAEELLYVDSWAVTTPDTEAETEPMTEPVTETVTEPVTETVTEPEVTETSVASATETETSPAPVDGTEAGGCGSIISVGTPLTVLTAAWLLLRRKEKDIDA